MLFKVSAAHVYSHQEADIDTIENCKICDVAVENQEAEFVVSNVISLETPVQTPFPKENLIYLPQTDSSKLVHFRLFGRPPPFVG